MSQALSVPSAPPVALIGGKLWIAALMLAAANFLAVLNMTIANVAVPNIAGALSAATSQGTWVITAYAVGEAITVPLTGWLSSRFGSVRVFFASMVLFGLFSVVCGLSTSIAILVVARIFQGLCGDPLMPLSQTLMIRIFPKEKVAVRCINHDILGHGSFPASLRPVSPGSCDGSTERAEVLGQRLALHRRNVPPNGR